MQIPAERVPGRRNSQWKTPELRMCLECPWRGKETHVAEKHHASCRVDNRNGWESGAVPSVRRGARILKSKKTDLVFRKFQGNGRAWLGVVLKELGKDQAFYCLPPVP